MTRSFHRIGADPDVDASFDKLRTSLDELKRMEDAEWGIVDSRIEETDITKVYFLLEVSIPVGIWHGFGFAARMPQHEIPNGVMRHKLCGQPTGCLCQIRIGLPASYHRVPSRSIRRKRWKLLACNFMYIHRVNFYCNLPTTNSFNSASKDTKALREPMRAQVGQTSSINSKTVSSHS